MKAKLDILIFEQVCYYPDMFETLPCYFIKLKTINELLENIYEKVYRELHSNDEK